MKNQIELRFSKSDKRGAVVFGVFVVVFNLLAVLITPFLFERVIFMVIFGVFCIGIAFLGVYIIERARWWRVVVSGDLFAVHGAFGGVRNFSVGEISTAKSLYDGTALKIYVDGRRMFTAGQSMEGYEAMFNFLADAGKIDFLQAQPMEHFVVRRKRWEAAFCFAIFLFFGWATLSGVWLQEDMHGGYFFAPVLSPVFLYYTIYFLRWRLTVAGEMLTVKPLLGAEKEYRVNEITKVILKRRKAVLYVNDKKIAHVSNDCVNYPALATRLKSEGIPVYENGRLYED